MITGAHTDSSNLPEPIIIPRPEHPISRKNIDREALKVLYRLRDAGFTAYLVGGGVRDLYIGKEPKDFDISTNARPGQLRKLFRNSRIIGKRFRLVQVFFPGNKIVEVSTFRCRSEFDLNGDDKVLATNNTFGTAVEDAFRRDLTINGLFYEIENFTIIDYVNGVDDLKKGVIRMIGDPDRRIVRDPVRMIRTIRHAARSGFTIEEKTWHAIKTHKDKLLLCPVSRIRDELLKDLQGGASKNWARLAIESGIFFVLFPFYQKVITDSGATARPRLDKVFTLIDRINKENHRLPDHLLFGLILIPWAEIELDLMAGRISREQFIFSRDLRTLLDENLAHLNLKRAIREEMVTLLSNLAVFDANEQKNKWPKSLKRKSYFNNCMAFYRMYDEIRGGEKVISLDISEPPKTRRPPRKRRAKHGSRKPFYSHDTKGGIFGFKK